MGKFKRYRETKLVKRAKERYRELRYAGESVRSALAMAAQETGVDKEEIWGGPPPEEKKIRGYD